MCSLLLLICEKSLVQNIDETPLQQTSTRNLSTLDNLWRYRIYSMLYTANRTSITAKHEQNDAKSSLHL